MRRHIALLKHFVRNSSRVFELFRESFWSAHASSRRCRMSGQVEQAIYIAMSRRLKLIVAYDGAPFAGWQSQSHRNTVQDHLERAFERVHGGAARVHGAGRTDAGVHALAQCAHVNLANRFLPAERWVEALNALLPPAIRVLRCRYVSQDFHARLSAKGKIYRYRIWNASVLPPFEYRRAWHVARQ